MSKSTFQWQRVSIFHNFGRLVLEETNISDMQENINNHIALSTVKHEIENYEINGYKKLPDGVFMGAQYHGKDIVFMLAYTGFREDTYIIYTRNE